MNDSTPDTPARFVVVPEGWQLVPKEPIHEMFFAAKEAVKDWSEYGIEWLERDGECWATGYRAMLAAAPSPPELEQCADSALPKRLLAGHVSAIEAASALDAKDAKIDELQIRHDFQRIRAGEAETKLVVQSALLDEARRTLELAMCKWNFYSKMTEGNDGFDLKTEKSSEGDQYRNCDSTLTKLRATGMTPGSETSV